MRKNLLLLSLAGVLTVTAQDIAVMDYSAPVQPVHVVQRHKTAPKESRPLKQLKATQRPLANKITPFAGPRRSAPAYVPAGYSFYESFEGWDGENITWLPDGWTRESHNDSELQDFERWSPYKGGGVFPVAPDGDYYMMISVAIASEGTPARAQDEWLITPELTVKENEELSFQEWISPLLCLDLTYFDWETWQFSQKVIVQDVEVHVREVGTQEWTKIYSAMDKYLPEDIDGNAMSDAAEDFVPVRLSLKDYEGKNIQIAFRYVGLDGNTSGIDAVAVGMPPLSGIHYAEPLHTQYFGFSDTWSALNAGIAVFPVNAPVTWANVSENEEADYIWTYNDPIDGEEVTGGHSDGLSLVYEPDFRSDFSRLNNLFYPHILKGSAEGFTSGSYQAPYTFLQAGGAAQYQLTEGLFEGTMLPFDHISEGFTYVGVPLLGEMDTPIFGYDKNCDAYWENFTFGNEKEEGYACYVDGIINSIYPAEAPLTVYGAQLQATVKVADADKIALRFRVVALNEEGVPDFDNPLATATATKDQMLIDNEDTNLHSSTFKVSFEKPLVLGNDNLGYIIVVDGYREGFEYFAPMQSALPHPEGYALSYVIKYATLDINEGFRYGLTPIAYVEGENGPCFNTFAIGLDAEYGYLGLIDEEPVVLNKEDSSKTVRFRTFTEPERLSITAPEGIIATASGRFDNAVLTIAKDDTKDVDGVVTLSDNARTVTIPVKAFAGISDIENVSDKAVTGTFTLSGIEVNGDELPAGVYIRRHADGTVSKVTIR